MRFAQYRAASADAGDLSAQVATAFLWGNGMLALCLLAVGAVIVPAQRRE